MEDLKILRQTKEHPHRYMFFCPGCKCGHWFQTQGNPSWTWNNSLDKPTVRASILVKGTKDIPEDIYNAWIKDNSIPLSEPIKTVCHSFITDGMIQFLDDCTHELKGKIVPLEVF